MIARLRQTGVCIAALASLVAMGACSGPAVRFHDGPAVTRVDDTRDIPEPKEREFWRLSHHINNFMDRQLRLRLDPVGGAPALDVNRFGEVVNSSWYETRTARLSPADVANGPAGDDPGPEAFLPWTITGMKVGGRNPGFVFKDTRGEHYICKFDKPHTPIVATAAGAVAGRLLWACGYHTPDDRVVIFARNDLVIGEGATFKTPAGNKHPLADEQIDDLLASVPSRQADGTYRALVSRFLPGKPLGGYAYRGTRDDDPNDTIPHQNRRSLRALRVFGAWLNHVDLKIDNTLDLYTEENGRHFVRHYLVDFDGCLGGYWAARHESRIGYAYDFDIFEFFTGVPALGLYKRPYEDLVVPAHPEVGVFEAEVFDPATWKPNYANDQLSACTPADAFWAGTVMAQLGEAHIRAAVGAARFNDPDAADVLARVLIARWEKTVDWALTRVSPVVDVDRIEVASTGGVRVAARNALSVNGRPSHLRFDARVLDGDGETLREFLDVASPDVTIPGDLTLAHDYLVVEWTARDTRTNHRLPPSRAHYARGKGLRVRGSHTGVPHAQGAHTSSSRMSSWRLVGILRNGQ